MLAGTASELLRASLPAAKADGQAVERPTLLPLPGELPPQEIAAIRLNRLARFGAALCSHPPDPRRVPVPPAAGSAETEARLFFDYLHGDFAAAAADLEKLDPLLSSPNERLSLLSLRAKSCGLAATEPRLRPSSPTYFRPDTLRAGSLKRRPSG